MRPILPTYPACVHDPDEGFVHQIRGLQRVFLRLAHQHVLRQAVKFCVHQGDELVEGLSVAPAPGVQQLRNFAASIRAHAEVKSHSG